MSTLPMERMGEWVVLAYHSIDNLDALLADDALLQQCCVLNGSLVCSRLQLAVAMQRLTNHLAVSGGQLRSRTMLSELMLMLSPTRNITEALRLFSVDLTSSSPPPSAATSSGAVAPMKKTVTPKTVLFALHNPQREEIGFVVEHVSGVAFPLTELHQHADADLVAKVYNVGEAELRHCGLEACVVNRIAVADI